MIDRLFSFFSFNLHCTRRTQEQKIFEEELYHRGLEEEQKQMIQKINDTIGSKELAVKFILQELDVAQKGDTFIQYFVEKSGFHISEYSGALEKFQQEREEIEKIQSFFIIFLNKISDEETMFKTAMAILNGVMEHWEIGKYSEERELLVEEEKVLATPCVDKKVIDRKAVFSLYLKKVKILLMGKLLTIENRLQGFLDTFSMPKEIEERRDESSMSGYRKEDIKEPEVIIKIYTDEDIDVLMEQYSHVIEEIIIGKINPKNHEEINLFKEEICLASVGGNNLASVFCAFFKVETSVHTFPLRVMDEKSQLFFIQILNTFEEKGFSENLYEYFEENRDSVYALATKGDMFMQYLIAFWYVLEDEDESNILKEQEFWYVQSASNGFKPAIEKMKEKVKI